MKDNIKFDIDQEVFIFLNNKPRKLKVTEITVTKKNIHYSLDSIWSTYYAVQESIGASEKELYDIVFKLNNKQD